MKVEIFFVSESKVCLLFFINLLISLEYKFKFEGKLKKKKFVCKSKSMFALKRVNI